MSSSNPTPNPGIHIELAIQGATGEEKRFYCDQIEAAVSQTLEGFTLRHGQTAFNAKEASELSISYDNDKIILDVAPKLRVFEKLFEGSDTIAEHLRQTGAKVPFFTSVKIRALAAISPQAHQDALQKIKKAAARGIAQDCLMQATQAIASAFQAALSSGNPPEQIQPKPPKP